MFEELIPDGNQRSLIILSLTFLLLISIYVALTTILKRLGKDPNYLVPPDIIRKVAKPLILILAAILLRTPALRNSLGMEEYAEVFRRVGSILFIFAFAWLVIRILRVVKEVLVGRYNMGEANNLKARIVFTQFTILERIVIFIVFILALGAALMTFESIREIGVSLFASAGVAGIIIGFSAQKLIATVIAGIQIALTQPIRLDDVVIVEGEWGRIEEISLTHVIVRIWDKRCLILPTTYFIEKPFQNWTKTSTDLLGTVFLYTDYTVPFEALRAELQRIVQKATQWNGQVANIQVTDSRATYVEVRATVSADDSGKAWELRVHVREKLIEFLQKNYPQSLAHTRVLLNRDSSANNS